jgi:hypothetical protein
MTARITKARRAELRRIADAATKGEWYIDEPKHADAPTRRVVRGSERINFATDIVCHPTADRDAAFIAASRTALPELLDEVDRLEADNERLRSAALEWQAAYSRITDEAARRALGEKEGE